MALESSIGTAAALQLFSALPLLSWDCELIGPLLLADDLAVQPTQYHNFEVVVPHGTGLGVEPDHDKVTVYTRKTIRISISPSRSLHAMLSYISSPPRP